MVSVTEQVADPYGDLIGGTFPTSAEVGVNASWDATVHNAGGSTGVIAFIIVNEPENPGDVVVKFEGTEYTIAPGFMLILSGTRDVCANKEVAGEIKFAVVGVYTLTLYGAHEDPANPGSWIGDTYSIVDG